MVIMSEENPVFSQCQPSTNIEIRVQPASEATPDEQGIFKLLGFTPETVVNITPKKTRRKRKSPVISQPPAPPNHES
jgi:hypothetical protein